MGLDYGSKTVGVALSDDAASLPMPLEVVRRDSEKRLRKTCARIEELIVQHNIGQIVVGLPLNMDGSEGERAQKARSFGEMLSRRSGLPLSFQDERLSSVEADELMDSCGIRSKEKRHDMIDAVAAAVILGDYLRNR